MACIGPGRRLGVLMPKLLSDGFESAGLGIEHHLGAQVPELMRCEGDAGASLQVAGDQVANSRLALRCTFDSYEQPCRAVADDLRRDAIAVLDKHLGDVQRNVEAKLQPVFRFGGRQFQRRNGPRTLLHEQVSAEFKRGEILWPRPT